MYSVWPIAKDVNATGIVGMIGLPLASSRLPDRTPLRAAVLPSLKMTTPEAPAAWAFRTLTPKKQVPRWIKAIRPGTKPAKSLELQPLVEPPGEGMMMPPAGCSVALVAEPMLCPGFQSVVRAKVWATGDASLQFGIPVNA